MPSKVALNYATQLRTCAYTILETDQFSAIFTINYWMGSRVRILY